MAHDTTTSATGLLTDPVRLAVQELRRIAMDDHMTNAFLAEDHALDVIEKALAAARAEGVRAAASVCREYGAQHEESGRDVEAQACRQCESGVLWILTPEELTTPPATGATPPMPAPDMGDAMGAPIPAPMHPATGATEGAGDA